MSREASSPPQSREVVALYMARLAPGSRASMHSALAKIAFVASGGRADAASFPWAELRQEHVRMLRAALAASLAPRTVNRYLSALRGVLREAWNAGAMDTEAYHRAIAVEGVRGSRTLAGREVSVDERRGLFEVCLRDPLPARGARDAALLAVLIGGGLRRSEVVRLELADLRVEDGGGVLRVVGKGDKERVVYLGAPALVAVERWIRHRGSAPGPLFVRVLRGGHVRLDRLGPQAVRVVLIRRLAEAGLAHATAHDLRRTFCGELLDAGADLATVQALLGHASPAQTARYDRRGERARKRAAELAVVPIPPAIVEEEP